MRKQYEELVDLTDRVKVWINGLLPRIEDNTSFGVQVRALLPTSWPPLMTGPGARGLLERGHARARVGIQVRTSLTRCRPGSDPEASLIEGQLKYHERRAKLASKLIKYPNVVDYQLALVRLTSLTRFPVRSLRRGRAERV